MISVLSGCTKVNITSEASFCPSVRKINIFFNSSGFWLLEKLIFHDISVVWLYEKLILPLMPLCMAVRIINIISITV